MSQADEDRLEEKLDKILIILNGDGKGEMGMVQKVSIMWKLIVVWPLCTTSAILGALITLVLQLLIK